MGLMNDFTPNMGHWRRIKKYGITIIFREIESSFESPIIFFPCLFRFPNVLQTY